MADYSQTKRAPLVVPNSAVESTWGLLEPLLTPQRLKREHLFGVPLSVSIVEADGKRRTDTLNDDDLKRIIERMVRLVETETKSVIIETTIEERIAYDRNEFEHFGKVQVKQRPVTSVEEFAIRGVDETILYPIPLEWLDTGYLHRGFLYIIPLAPGLSGGTAGLSTASPWGLAMLGIMQRSAGTAIPGYWWCRYTAGFRNNAVPALVNELVGARAAIDILSMLGVTFARTNSQSLGIDGLSQSVSGPGQNIYAVRIKELQEKYDKLMKRYQNMFGGKFRVGSL